MVFVKIIPIRKHKIQRDCIWVVIDSNTNKALYAEKSMSEAIYHVEQEGYVLEPNA